MRRYVESGKKRIAWQAVEQPGLRKDGVEISMELSFGEVDNNGTRLFTGVIRNITERKQAQELLDASHEQLRRLAARLQSIREEERTRIAREVHDELGQMLTGLKFELSRLKSGISAAGLLKQLDSALGLIDATIGTVQRIAGDLRPSVLDDIGLRPAIEWQACDFKRRTEIECELDLGPEGAALDRKCSTAVFRIFQEVLTNVARHADATRVDVTLVENDSDIVLEVHDDGKGIAGAEIEDPSSLGLLGMRERAHDLGGDVRIRRAESGGTVVTMRIPLAP
jgi:signal transduction histidine kinase